MAPTSTDAEDGPPSFAQRVWRVVRGWLFPRYWIAIMVDEPLTLVVNSDGREVTADGKARMVRAGEQLLCAFDAVQSVDLAHHPRSEHGDKPDHWSISLYLGRSQRAFVGRSRKHKHAARAAARLAKMMDKPVRPLEAVGPERFVSSR